MNGKLPVFSLRVNVVGTTGLIESGAPLAPGPVLLPGLAVMNREIVKMTIESTGL
jgi:hypothetical protein